MTWCVTDTGLHNCGLPCFFSIWGRVWVHHLSLSSGHCQISDGWWLPPPIAIWAVADQVFFYLLTYVNECKWVDHDEFWVDWVYCLYGPGDRTRKPPPIAVPVVAWNQARVVNSNSTSNGKETRQSHVWRTSNYLLRQNLFWYIWIIMFTNGQRVCDPWWCNRVCLTIFKSVFKFLPRWQC